MSANRNHNQPQPTDDEFEELWGLHESPRLPTGRAGWESFQSRSIMKELRIHSHANDYASIVGVPSKAETIQKVAKLIDAFPLDFQTAAESISPEGWRMLYYSSSYSLANIGAYNFHANQELRHICEFDEFTEGIPSAWIGSDDEPRVVAQKTRGILDEIGPEPSKAAYCILAAAQRIALSKAEVLRCQWWSPAWIQNLSATLNAKQ